MKFFSEPKLPKSPQRLLLCGFSGCRGRSRAGQLDYNTTGNRLCQHLFFGFFDTFFDFFFSRRYIVISCDGRRIIPHPILSVNTEVALLLGSTIYESKSVHFDEPSGSCARFFSYMAAISLPSSCSRNPLQDFSLSAGYLHLCGSQHFRCLALGLPSIKAQADHQAILWFQLVHHFRQSNPIGQDFPPGNPPGTSHSFCPSSPSVGVRDKAAEKPGWPKRFVPVWSVEFPPTE